MYKDGHRGVALLLMVPLTGLFGIIGFGMTILAVVVCRLPDLDHDYGWLPHRGLTHTIWFAVGAGAVTTAGLYLGFIGLPIEIPAWPLALLAGTTVFLGIVSHLIADALTVGRGDHAIRPFQPLSSEQLIFGLVRSNSRIWNVALLVGGIGAQILALGMFYRPF